MVKGRGNVLPNKQYRVCRRTVCEAGGGAMESKQGSCLGRSSHTVGRTNISPKEVTGPKCASGWGGRERACQESANPFF